MIRSLHETRRDPLETPLSGGASGSRATAQQVASPLQADSPNTQSEGEGSVIPNRPPRIVTVAEAQQPAQLQPRPFTPEQICLLLEDRIKKERLRMAELVEKVGSMDQEFTEVDMNELNDLKQSVAGCQRELANAKAQRPVEAIPRPPVRLPSNDPPIPGDTTPMGVRKSRSRPRSHVRGRSKADKRRRQPDSGDRRSSTRRKADPIVVTPPVTIPRPTVASIFQGGAEDLSSSCPTPQEPAQTVPQIFQSAGAALHTGGLAPNTPQPGVRATPSDPPQDPRSQSERRRVVIRTPQEDSPQGRIPAPFTGRAYQLRSSSAEPQLPPGENSLLESRQDPQQQGRSTYYGR